MRIRNSVKTRVHKTITWMTTKAYMTDDMCGQQFHFYTLQMTV